MFCGCLFFLFLPFSISQARKPAAILTLPSPSPPILVLPALLKSTCFSSLGSPCFNHTIGFLIPAGPHLFPQTTTVNLKLYIELCQFKLKIFQQLSVTLRPPVQTACRMAPGWADSRLLLHNGSSGLPGTPCLPLISVLSHAPSFLFGTLFWVFHHLVTIILHRPRLNTKFSERVSLAL